MHARPQSLSSLTDSQVNDSLLQIVPNFNEALLRRYLHDIFIHITCYCMTPSSLRRSDLDCLATRSQDRRSPVSPAAAAGWCRRLDVPERCLRTTSFDTLELEIVVNYSVHSQLVNASFVQDLANRSVHFD